MHVTEKVLIQIRHLKLTEVPSMDELIRSHPVDGEIIYTCMQTYSLHKKLLWLRNTRNKLKVHSELRTKH